MSAPPENTAPDASHSHPGNQPDHMHSLLRENRVFPPPPAFAATAQIPTLADYESLYRRSVDQPEAFWSEAAAGLDWSTPFTTVLEGAMGSATWFNGGKLNLAHNCVDRHAQSDLRDQVAILWEGEPGEVRRITYAELHVEVQRFAAVLKHLGIHKGDRVAIYMGMCPELAMALLACARIGAIHSVIFGGFAAQAITDRVNDSACKLILTQDGSYRRGAEVNLKAIVDEAVTRCPSVEHVVVHRRTGSPVPMQPGRDLWLDEQLAALAGPPCP